MTQEQNSFLANIRHLNHAWQEGKILSTAVVLGVFDKLHNKPASVQELSRQLDCTYRGMEILCDALVAAGYLNKNHEKYSNTEDTTRYLVRGQPESIAFITGHRNQLFHSWANLEQVVQKGQKKDVSKRATLTDKEANQNFILGMAEASKERIDPLISHLDLKNANIFVDLGGGPAHYSCAVVKQHPHMQAILVDLPMTVNVAKEYIKQQNCQEQVSTKVADFYNDSWIQLDQKADVLLISQVLHVEGEQQNKELLKKVYPLLADGGQIAISENIVDDSRTHPIAGAFFAVNMLAATDRGKTYTKQEISQWLGEAGFTVENIIDVAPRTTLFLARK